MCVEMSTLIHYWQVQEVLTTFLKIGVSIKIKHLIPFAPDTTLLETYPTETKALIHRTFA